MAAFLFSFGVLTSCGNGDGITGRYNEWIDSGSAAEPDVRAAMLDSDWRVRSHAIMAAGKINASSITPEIINRLMYDDSIHVRNSAISALGNLKALSAVPVLIDILGGHCSEQTAILAVRALGKMRDSAALPVLHSLLSRSGIRLSDEIVRALIVVGDREISREMMRTAAVSTDAHYLMCAARVMGELPVGGADAVLVSVFARGGYAVHGEIINALGKMRTGKGVPLLIDELKRGEKKTTLPAINALALIDSVESIDPLCEILAEGGAQAARSAAKVLARLSHPGVAERVFSEAVANPACAVSAAIVLGKKKFTPALPFLRAILKTNYTGDEIAAALGAIGDHESIPALMEIVKRGDRNCIRGAVRGLGQLGSRESVPLIITLLKDSAEFPELVIDSLGMIGDERAARPIIDYYYSNPGRMSLVIARALGSIGGKDVMRFIRSNIYSDDSERTAAAKYALSHLGKKNY